MRIHGRREMIVAALAVCLLGASGGCSPEVEAEKAYMEGRREQQRMRAQIRDTIRGGTEENAAVEMVKSWPAPEGEGTVEAWIAGQVAADARDVLFPRWQAMRRGIGRYDVWYSYTSLAADGRIEKKGHAWSADLVLKLVAGPRDLTSDELGTRTSRYFESSGRESTPVELRQD